jgi:hypothetical protein
MGSRSALPDDAEGFAAAQAVPGAAVSQRSFSKPGEFAQRIYAD